MGNACSGANPTLSMSRALEMAVVSTAALAWRVRLLHPHDDVAVPEIIMQVTLVLPQARLNKPSAPPIVKQNESPVPPVARLKPPSPQPMALPAHIATPVTPEVAHRYRHCRRTASPDDRAGSAPAGKCLLPRLLPPCRQGTCHSGHLPDSGQITDSAASYR